jgi:hypothetical protein
MSWVCSWLQELFYVFVTSYVTFVEYYYGSWDVKICVTSILLNIRCSGLCRRVVRFLGTKILQGFVCYPF